MLLGEIFSIAGLLTLYRVDASFVVQETFSDSLNEQFANLSQFNDSSCPFETSTTIRNAMHDLLSATAANIQELPGYRLPFIVNCSVFFVSKVDNIICDTEFVNVQTLLSYEGNKELPATEASFLHKGNILKTSMVVGLEPLQHPQVLYWLYFKLPPTQTASQTNLLSLTHPSSVTITDSNSKSDSTSATHINTQSITIHKSETLTKSDTASLGFESQSLSRLNTISETNTNLDSLSTSPSKTGTSSRTLSQSLSCSVPPLQEVAMWSSLAYEDSTNQMGRYIVACAIVIDTFTNLMWEQTVSSSTYFWNASASTGSAQAYCTSISKGGYTDWRLPTPLELESVIDYTLGNPCINDIAFPNTPTNHFWTSTIVAANPSYAWHSRFDYGYILTDTIGTTNNVRCVRSDDILTSDRFFDEEGTSLTSINVIVKDHVTGFIWQRTQVSTLLPWSASFALGSAQWYCQNLVIGSHGAGSWRLPKVKELSTLIDYTVYGPSINTTAFLNTATSWFWTSTPIGDFARFINFNSGAVDLGTNISNPNYVRCILNISSPTNNGRWSIIAYEDATNQTARYYVSGTLPNAIVTDDFTGLMWEQQVSNSTYFWNTSSSVGSAQAYCASLTKGGYVDWRLPTPQELQSLIDYTIITIPPINEGVFLDTPSSYFWTAQNYAGDVTQAWDYRFNNSGAGPNHGSGTLYFNPLSTAYSIRCVRGLKKTNNNYTDIYGNPLTMTDSVVKDSSTGLTWQRSVSLTIMTWNYALTYCQNLVIGNYGAGSWQLPTVKELTSIVDYTTVNPSINGTAFPNTPYGTWYWTSSSFVINAGHAVHVRFDIGDNNYDPESVSLYVRCILNASAPANNGMWSLIAYEDATNQTARYYISGTSPNATVTDDFTGLIWEQTPSTTTVTWNTTVVPGSAQEYCQSLTKGGYNDWRLPIPQELQSLVDYTVDYHGPTINTTVFPGTSTSYYYTSLPIAGSGTIPWYVSFGSTVCYGGLVYTQSPGWSNCAPFKGYPWCVRGSTTPSIRYTDEHGNPLNGTSTQVKDQVTRLIWQRTQASSTYNWTAALSYCSTTLTLGSQTWRLPTVRELGTLVDYTIAPPGPTINVTAFPGTAQNAFWASSSFAGGAGHARSVGFSLVS